VAAIKRLKADETNMVNQMHEQVNQEAKRKLKEHITIQSAVPAVIKKPMHVT